MWALDPSTQSQDLISSRSRIGSANQVISNIYYVGVFPVADLHSKILDAPPPPWGPNSFNFMQFLGKFGKIVCWRLPWRVGAPSSGKSWIRHCFPNCFHWIQRIFVIIVKLLEPATSCVSYQDATTAPARHMWETGSLNWSQFMLQWFIWFPEFTEFLFYLGKTNWIFSLSITESYWLVTVVHLDRAAEFNFFLVASDLSLRGLGYWANFGFWVIFQKNPKH